MACGVLTSSSEVNTSLHGSAGTFDIGLPLAGTPGIECRTGGSTNDYQIVVTFGGPVTFSTAQVTTGTGSVSSTSTNNNQVFINLTGVTNAQTMQVTLLGVNDGTETADVSIPMSILVGDVNATGRVDGSDISLVRQQNFQPVNDNPGTSNFRADVNVSGNIDSADVGIVQEQNNRRLP